MSGKYKLIIFLIITLAAGLRLFKVSTTPHDLYIDEVSIGYNAYSILKTGTDEWGEKFPLYFKAFGEYKLPVYIYTVALFQAVLGKTSLSVRLPSVLAGVLTVFCFILLVKILSTNKKLALLSGLLLAVSPWHLQFSRAGFEASLSLFFIVLATYLFILGIRKNMLFIIISAIFFFMSLYTYFVSRIFVPLLILALIIIFSKQILALFKNKKNIVYFSFLTLLSLLFVPGLFSARGFIRAGSLSFVREVKISPDIFWENKIFLNLTAFMQNYFKNLSLDYLFFAGDQQGRHSVREIGQNYVWMLPFLLLGAVKIFRFHKKSAYFFLSFLFISPLGAALALPNPHALRTLYLVVPLTFISALGLYSLLKNRKFFTILITFIFTYYFINYLHSYFVHYPKRTSPDWWGGYKEAIGETVKRSVSYDKVYLTRDLTFGKQFLGFYGPFPIPVNFEFVSSPFNLKDSSEKFLYLAPFWEKWDGTRLMEFKDRGGDGQFILWEN